MSDTIRRNKIIQGRVAILPAFNQSIDSGNTPIGQEYIARLRPDSLHVVDPVVFLFRAGQLVLLYNSFFIISHRTAGNQAGLALPIHNEPIDIEAGFVFFEQDPFFDKGLKIFLRLLIDIR